MPYLHEDLELIRSQLRPLDEKQRADHRTYTENVIANLTSYKRMSNLQRDQVEAARVELRILDEVESADRVEKTRREKAKRDLHNAVSRPDAVFEAGSQRDDRPSSDPWEHDLPQFGQTREGTLAMLVGRARTAIERCTALDSGRERITRALDDPEIGSESQSKIARWTVATSDPAYARAFYKLAADPDNGHREFDEVELRAFRRVKSEARAMGLTDTAGGFLVPFQLDPTVVISNSGGTNPIRDIARTVVATGDVWNGVSSAGVTSAWYAEFAEIADGSPTLAQPAIPIHKQATFVPVSFEAYDDMVNGAQEIAKLMRDEADQTDAEAFTIGTGSGQPTGIVTALIGSGSVVSQSGLTLDAPDFFATQEALGPRFQANASWIMALPSMNRGRQIIAGTGLTTPLLSDATNPPTLLGKPVFEASYMDGTVTASAADYLAVYGDFQHYIVAERIGTTLELVPHLMGPNRLPTAARGWLMWRRVGADSIADNAFRVLNKSA